ncbi:hypothetical protein EG329_004562 [Mollisiaceae sp. DMI_Dod_QoI]|nr:hypothetical protein EG329_004562 [Helotiales sp. DMI_Dod_QoI]
MATALGVWAKVTEQELEARPAKEVLQSLEGQQRLEVRAERTRDTNSGDEEASEGSQETTDEEFGLGEPSQPPVDLKSRGYEVVPGEASSNLIPVTIKKHDGILDKLELDTLADSIGVQIAVNFFDEGEPGRLPLRSLATNVWSSLSGKSMGDLKSINYQHVINEDVLASFPLAYAAMNMVFDKNARTALHLSSTDAGFPIMMNTVFGGGASKMLVETAGLEGRSITSIDLFTGKSDVQFNF